MVKAISLISGGLDSILAAKLLLEQDIEVEALTLNFPFMPSKNPLDAALSACRDLKIKSRVLDLNKSTSYLRIIESPKFGYGKNLNPCVDCHAFMLKEAKKIMIEDGASFIITGDVLGERPMSQMKNTLLLIDKEASVEGLVLRPLSAKLLAETVPEREGWVIREKLFDINGRSRKRQFEMAKRMKIKKYQTPGGGCLLTDGQFCQKVKDLIAHKQFDFYNAKLLKAGRHFRLDKFTKLIVGRDKEDNELIEELRAEASILLKLRDVPGPTALLNKEAAADLQNLAAGILSAYTKSKGPVSVSLLIPGTGIKIIEVMPLKKEDVRKLML